MGIDDNKVMESGAEREIVQATGDNVVVGDVCEVFAGETYARENDATASIWLGVEERGVEIVGAEGLGEDDFGLVTVVVGFLEEQKI